MRESARRTVPSERTLSEALKEAKEQYKASFNNYKEQFRQYYEQQRMIALTKSHNLRVNDILQLKIVLKFTKTVFCTLCFVCVCLCV